MATRKSSTLKAKTTRRAAKPAKLMCPVEKIGRDQYELARLLGDANNKLASAKGQAKTDAEELRTCISERMQANRTAASFLEPTSDLGMAFLLLSTYSDVQAMSTLEDAARRNELFRRVDRCLYGVLDYLYERRISIGSVGSWYYMPDNWNPHDTLAIALEEGAK